MPKAARGATGLQLLPTTGITEPVGASPPPTDTFFCTGSFMDALRTGPPYLPPSLTGLPDPHHLQLSLPTVGPGRAHACTPTSQFHLPYNPFYLAFCVPHPFILGLGGCHAVPAPDPFLTPWPTPAGEPPWLDHYAVVGSVVRGRWFTYQASSLHTPYYNTSPCSHSSTPWMVAACATALCPIAKTCCSPIPVPGRNTAANHCHHTAL